MREKKTKTKNVTQLKKSTLDKTQKIKTWQNLKTEMAMKHKNSKCDKSAKKNLNFAKLKTQNVAKIKNSKCD